MYDRYNLPSADKYGANVSPLNNYLFSSLVILSSSAMGYRTCTQYTFRNRHFWADVFYFGSHCLVNLKKNRNRFKIQHFCPFSNLQRKFIPIWPLFGLNKMNHTIQWKTVSSEGMRLLMFRFERRLNTNFHPFQVDNTKILLISWNRKHFTSIHRFVFAKFRC